MPKRVKYLMIDMDNTLVKYDDHFVPYVTDHIINAVMELDRVNRFRAFQGNRALIERIAQESFKQHGQSIIGLAAQMQIPVATISEAYHERLVPAEYINPDEEQKQNLRIFKEWLKKENPLGENYVLFTQAARANAAQVIKHLGCDDIFNEANMVTSTDFPNFFKHRDGRAYRAAYKKLPKGALPKETMIIDDSRSVLKRAFAMGLNRSAVKPMTTCLVNHGQESEERVAHITYEVPNISGVVGLVSRLNL